MKKMTGFLFIVLLSSPSLFAQKNRPLLDDHDFVLATPSYKIPHSLYRTIAFLDSRKDTTNLGFLQFGIAKTNVVPKTSLSVQLTTMMDSMTDGTAMNGRLLLQIKQFSFAEVTGTFNEWGYCTLRAILYADVDGLYRKIALIDTQMVIKSKEATRSTYVYGSRLIPEFIEPNLLNAPANGDTYTRSDLDNIDSVEKQKIKLYTTTTFTDGVYLTYQSYKVQVPDKPISARIKDEKIEKVRTTDSAGKWVKVKPGRVYGLVYQGVPYVATNYGFYPLEKVGSDLFFIGQDKVTPNGGDVVIGFLIDPILGPLLNSNDNATFEMQIDYFSGRFIHIRKIDLPAESNAN